MPVVSRNSIPNIDSIQFKTKELLRCHLGCHGNCVTIATRLLADACHAKEPPYQILTQYDRRKSSY